MNAIVFVPPTEALIQNAASVQVSYPERQLTVDVVIRSKVLPDESDTERALQEFGPMIKQPKRAIMMSPLEVLSAHLKE